MHRSDRTDRLIPVHKVMPCCTMNMQVNKSGDDQRETVCAFAGGFIVSKHRFDAIPLPNQVALPQTFGRQYQSMQPVHAISPYA
jgi:hypothetical protein